MRESQISRTSPMVLCIWCLPGTGISTVLWMDVSYVVICFWGGQTWSLTTCRWWRSAPVEIAEQAEQQLLPVGSQMSVDYLEGPMASLTFRIKGNRGWECCVWLVACRCLSLFPYHSPLCLACFLSQSGPFLPAACLAPAASPAGNACAPVPTELLLVVLRTSG